MKTLEYRTLDAEKKEWGEGPWMEEPDKKQWMDIETGMPCLAVRHPTGGHWCGYVGVAEGHPYYQKDYQDHYDLPCHGGPTFSEMCQPGETEERGVCHIPGKGEPDHVWWFGFDCAHYRDYQPGLAKYCFARGGTYRTLQYVEEECKVLAKALKDAKDNIQVSS